MILTLVDQVQETTDVYSFVFHPDQPVTWQAGQYLKYTLPHDNPDERGINHYFTISSAPFEKVIRLTTRFDFEKGSSFKKALFALKIGQTVESKLPSGDFTLTDPDQEYVFIAGGIGITPFHSILLELDHTDKPINVTLLYANRNDEIVFKDQLDQIANKNSNFKINYVINPSKIDQSSLPKLVTNFQAPIWYVSGPEPMVEKLSEILTDLGVAEDHLKQDFFPGYTD